MGGTAILIIKVVGVFPDIEGQKGCQTFYYRVGGVGLLSDCQLSVLVGGQPYPARTEQACAFRLKFGFEGVKASPLFVYLCGKGSGGRV